MKASAKEKRLIRESNLIHWVMVISILLLLVGLGILVKGADWLVVGASALAKKHHVSDLAIGLTIVAFGTSAPELVVNAFAAYEGHQGIVFGNVIGSNNFNLFIILGIAGLIIPLSVQSSTVWKEIPFSFLAVVVLYLLTNDLMSSGATVLTRVDGLVLLVLFAAFLYYVFKQLKSDPALIIGKEHKLSGLKTFAMIIGGLLGLVGGGKLVVDNAVDIAAAMGVSDKIIGLTIVAAGTSLPELATSIVAALKKNIDIAVGNIIGSNIFNIFLILSVSALIRPLQYEKAFNTDLLVLALGTAFLFIAMFTGQKKRLDRWEAGILLLAYGFYLFYILSSQA